MTDVFLLALSGVCLLLALSCVAFCVTLWRTVRRGPLFPASQAMYDELNAEGYAELRSSSPRELLTAAGRVRQAEAAGVDCLDLARCAYPACACPEASTEAQDEPQAPREGSGGTQASSVAQKRSCAFCARVRRTLGLAA